MQGFDVHGEKRAGWRGLRVHLMEASNVQRAAAASGSSKGAPVTASRLSKSMMAAAPATSTPNESQARGTRDCHPAPLVAVFLARPRARLGAQLMQPAPTAGASMHEPQGGRHDPTKMTHAALSARGPNGAAHTLTHRWGAQFPNVRTNRASTAAAMTMRERLRDGCEHAGERPGRAESRQDPTRHRGGAGPRAAPGEAAHPARCGTRPRGRPRGRPGRPPGAQPRGPPRRRARAPAALQATAPRRASLPLAPPRAAPAPQPPPPLAPLPHSPFAVGAISSWAVVEAGLSFAHFSWSRTQLSA